MFWRDAEAAGYDIGVPSVVSELVPAEGTLR
jgi:hypothetical protein